MSKEAALSRDPLHIFKDTDTRWTNRYDYFSKPEKSSKKLVMIGVGIGFLAAIALVGAIVATYFLANQTFNRAISLIKGGSSTLMKMLIAMAPITAAAFAIGLFLYLRRASEKKERVEDASKFQRFKEMLDQMKPSKKQLCITLAVLVILTGIIGITIGVFCKVSVANQWLNHQALPEMKHLLDYKLRNWQMLSMIGGYTLALILGNITLDAIHKKVIQRKAQAAVVAGTGAFALSEFPDL